jgi:hypothetical protein
MHEILARHTAALFGRDDVFGREPLRSLGRGINPALAEKAVHALEYVAQLHQTGIPFIFTGGTAAQLLLASGITRLSKDVDVIAPEGDVDDWRQAVRRVAKRFGDEVYVAEEEQRDHGGLNIPAAHFLIRYPTIFPSDTTPDIELDVVFASVGFPTQETRLATRYYDTKEALAASTPTVEGLLGGKLSALGPGTIGIPRGKSNFDVATGKQLFDVSHLFDVAKDLGAVARSYRSAYEQQVTYHPPDARPTIEVALEDAMYALKLLSAQPGTKGPNPEWHDDLSALSQAAPKLRGYVGDRERFDRVGARRAASRTALGLALVRSILLGHLTPDEAQVRWENHRSRIAAEEGVPQAIAAAASRLRQISWDERPHIHLREFPQTVGPEALLFWDAAYQEIVAARTQG